MRNDFAAFILSHGRANKIYTYNNLRKSGYTGKIYIVIDDEDATKSEYINKYGNDVIEFCKKVYADQTDEGDNFDNRRTTTHARNAIFEIAKEKGYRYFVMLDDDYTDFIYKFNGHGEFEENRIYSLDKIFQSMLDYLDVTAAHSVAMAQNGDFIGGSSGTMARKVKPRRKCMNTFFCRTDKPFQFISRLNEDVNTYMTLGAKGVLFLTIPNIAIIQKQTQANSGGMTEAYLDSGTYVKSFYTVMYAPSCTKIAMMGEKHRRLHHRISWRHAVPQIVHEQYKKTDIKQ